jgi:hemolysin D
MDHYPPRLDADALDFAPAILALQDRPAAPLPRLVLYTLITLFAVLLLWASFGKLDIIAVAEGKLVPQTYVKIVQPADAGIVQEILVQEGTSVETGQVLMRMDTKLSEADTRALATELQHKALQLRRINAELEGTPLSPESGDPPELFGQIEAQYLAHRQAYQDALAQEHAVLARAKQELSAAVEIESKLEQVIPVYQTQVQALEKLARDGFAGNLAVLDKQRERIEKEQELRAQHHTVASLEATIAEAEKRLDQITSSYRQQLHNERVDTQGEYQKLGQEWVKQQHKNSLLELKAPQAGIVKDIATHTPGTVVSPGTILMTLVPREEPLQAEVMIENQDVGFVHPHQKVKLKLAAYPFQKYGMLDGTVSHLSADASDRVMAGSENSIRDGGKTALLSPYRARVALQTQFLEVAGERLQLTPGMQVVAEIHQGRRTVLEYLLSPLRKAFREAGRER